MTKKINERIPSNSGDGAGFKQFNAVQSPWNKLMSYQEALHYASRFEAVLSAAVAQAYRIIIPDYNYKNSDNNNLEGSIKKSNDKKNDKIILEKIDTNKNKTGNKKKCC